MTDHRGWLVLTFGAESQYRGNEGYEDELTSIYRYDSNVPNSRRVRKGDVLVICDHGGARGIGIVEMIDVREGQKILRRCPHCRTTGIKRRKTMRPIYRCNNGHAFNEPMEESVDVTNFAAEYGGSFSLIEPPVERKIATAFTTMPSAQLSIRELDLHGFWPVIAPRLSNGDAAASVENWIEAFVHPEQDPGVAPEVSQAEALVQQLAGRSSGQRFLQSAESRSALEQYAMRQAETFYRGCGWDVSDVSRSRSFDLHCTRPGGEELRVEVKATQGDGNTVLLTPGEVAHSMEHHPRVELFVVYNLELIEHPDGEVRVSGGMAFRVPKWVAEDENLTTLGYSYLVPATCRQAIDMSSEVRY